MDKPGLRWVLALGVMLSAPGCTAEDPAGPAPDGPAPEAGGDASGPDGLAPEGGGLDGGGLDGTGDGIADGTAYAGGVFTLKVSGRTLELMVLGDNMVRVHYLPASGKGHPERGWTTVVTSWPTAPLTFTQVGSEYRYKTAELEIRVAKSDASVSFFDLAGQAISLDVAGQAAAGSYLRNVRKVLPVDEHFYGLGEKTGPLDKRGLHLKMWTTDPLYPVSDYTTTTDPIYQAVPFLLGLRQGTAYGLYLNSTFCTHFDMGKTVSGELELRTEGGDLDYFFIYGPAVSRVVQTYTGLTGRMPLPPLWALGYHQCRWSYYPEAVVRQITAELRTRKIPCDGFWLDIDYMDGFRSFTWDKTHFPDPTKLLADLDKQGFKVTAIIDPGIKEDPGGSYSVYNDGVKQSHFVTLPGSILYVGKVWPGNAVFPDYTRPATRTWWAGLVKSFVAVGLKGIWIDMNEPVTWEPSGFPLGSVFDGEGVTTDHKEARNVYALLMARATRAGLEQAAPNGRPFVLTRSGFAGIQRYATVWTGDMESSWSHLGMAPAMLMNMGLSGIAFAGTDVGGFSGNPGGELFARWIQLGAVSPFFRTHVQHNTPAQEPWSFGSTVEGISRSHIELRYKLLPYIYSLVRQASVKGDPPLRPLLYEFPDDTSTYGLSEQLMLGPHLMVAPVLFEKRLAQALYLPAGTWFDFWSGAVFSGGQTASVPAPLTQLPLLVRDGAILPFTELTQYVGEITPQTATLDLYPVPGSAPAVSTFTLYQDDGSTRAYEKGTYRELALKLTAASSGATLTVSPPQGTYTSPEKHLYLRIHGVASTPTGVTVGSTALTKRSSVAELSSADGWYYDAASRIAFARLPFPGLSGTTVTCTYDATLPLVKKVTVTFSVTLPASTPAGTVYMASNLYGWKPDGAQMTRTGNVASYTLALEEGMALEYKYTLGTWSSVEKASDCSELANRQLAVKDPGSGTQVAVDTVANWAGSTACP